ncbi:fungal-specific transcription factor domain-containing protein [Cubamyces menziesii]|nr:fungal-specific transcription factor domain-containing protein [Cubamyces menziesii]
MASETGGSSGLPDNVKRPKLLRACDLCRKKKSDGVDMPDNYCSKCKSYGIECTYDVVNKRPPNRSYVDLLESRLQKMEEVFDRPPQVSTSATSRVPSDSPSPPGPTPVPPPSLVTPIPPDPADLDPSDDEMEASRRLISSFRKFTIRPEAVRLRYHGKSSSLMLLQAAVDMRAKYDGVPSEDILMPPLDPTGMPRVDVEETLRSNVYSAYSTFARIALGEDMRPFTDFPPPDLMHKLVDAYFTNMNVFVPVLHRQILEQGIEEGLHLRDEGFGGVVLLVCANGCGWLKDSDDPRIAEASENRRPGFKWFLQVERSRRSILATPRLYDLQRFLLMACYLANFGTPHGCWSLIGLGIRMVQDVGAHRQKTYNALSRPEGELWKRAFWCLLSFDRTISFNLGRPCAMQDEDFDVEPLIECDDEYWNTGDPETDFKQPPGKPSKVAYFNCFCRMMQIMAFASRTIYSINKSKILLGFVGPEWEQRIVSELDSASNKWIDLVPDHLRWDPHREDHVFLCQSAALYTKYYQLQIFVHRPFLPLARKANRLTLPSLAICTNAARSLVHVCDVQYKRTGKLLMHNRGGLFHAAIVLLINMWGGKKAGLFNPSANEDVQKCMSMLKVLEPTSDAATRLWHVLDSLYNAGDFKSPAPEPSRKRGRDTEHEASSSTPEAQVPWAPSQVAKPATTAPLRKMGPQVQQPADKVGANTQSNTATLPNEGFSSPYSHSDATTATPQFGSSPSYLNHSSQSYAWAGPSNTSEPFDLPLSTEELGRIPLTHGFTPAHFDPVAPPQNQQEYAMPSFGATATSFTMAQPQAQSLWTENGGPFVDATVPGMDPSSEGFSSVPLGMGVHVNGGAGQAPSLFDFSQASQPSQQPYTMPYASQVPGVTHDATAYAPPQGNVNTDQLPGGTGQFDAAPQFSADDLALADNALAMWSTAPTSMDWGDWGAFFNTFGGPTAGGPGPSSGSVAEHASHMEAGSQPQFDY